MVIVSPLDYRNSPAIRPETFNLMNDFPNLTKDMVYHSTMYYQMWAVDDYVRESMSLQVQLLRNNTQPDLWNKIQDEVRSCPLLACQTGPTYFHSALRRIHNCSESTLDLVLQKVKHLKISDYESEDIDTIVRTLNIAVTLLHHSSSSDRNYITHDFARDVLRMFQTSTIAEFNVIFAEIERRCQVEADSKGKSVVPWPPIEEIIQLALTAFHRLSSSGHWIQGPAPAAFPATPVLGWEPGSCFNCGKKGHGLGDCNLPHDEAAIASNRNAMAEYRKAHPKKTNEQSGRGSGRGNRSGRGRGRNPGRGNSRGRGRGGSSGNKPARKFASDGKPLKLNHFGNYVLDQTRWHAMQKEQTIDKLTALISPGDAAAPAAAPGSASLASTITTAASTAATGTVASEDRASQIREAVARCFT
jgi:hypothetical protein